MKRLATVLIVTVLFVSAAFMTLTIKNNLSFANNEGLSVLWNGEIDSFVDNICKGKESDYEQISAIYDWIIVNIKYDYNAEAIYQYFDIEKTMQTKKGVCFDFASLFACMCRTRKIPCRILDGYSRDNSTYKHSWNRVYFDGTWWNVDVTYDAVTYQSRNGKLYGFKNVGDDYLSDDADYVITRIY